jgi:hypothetical protein
VVVVRPQFPTLHLGFLIWKVGGEGFPLNPLGLSLLLVFNKLFSWMCRYYGELMAMVEIGVGKP